MFVLRCVTTLSVPLSLYADLSRLEVEHETEVGLIRLCQKKTKQKKQLEGRSPMQRPEHTKKARTINKCVGVYSLLLKCCLTHLFLFSFIQFLLLLLKGVVAATGCEVQSRLLYLQPQIPAPTGDSLDFHKPAVTYNLFGRSWVLSQGLHA